MPSAPGRFVFNGIRWWNDGHSQCVSLRERVEVMRAAWPPHPLLVKVQGSKTQFRLDRFEGEWEPEGSPDKDGVL